MSDYREQGKYGALATIVSRVGAAPRHVGAKVLIEPVSEKHKEIYRGILECLACGQRALAITRADDLPFQKALITEGGVSK